MTRKRLLTALAIVAVCGIGWFFYQLLGPVPAIRVARETTYLTTPLADDGLPDYAKWLLDQQREGVTPENNAAVPLLQAMWPMKLSPEDAKLVCDAMGVPAPQSDGMYDLSDDDSRDDSIVRSVAIRLLAEKGITPDAPIQSKQAFDDWRSKWSVQYRAAVDNARLSGGAGPPQDFGNISIIHPFSEAMRRAKDILERCPSPWSTEQFPELAQWIERHERQYALLEEAGKRSHFYMPSPTLLTDPKTSFINVKLPDASAMGNAHRLLKCRAMLQLGNGDFASSWDTCQTMYRLADHVPPDSLVSVLVAIGGRRKADDVVRNLLVAPNLPKEVAKEIHAYFAPTTIRLEVADAIDNSERLVMITTVLSLTGERGAADPEAWGSELGLKRGSAWFQNVSVDWNLVLEHVNSYYDRCAESIRSRDPPMAEAVFAEIEAQAKDRTLSVRSVLRRTDRSRLVGDIVAALLLPAISHAQAAEDRHNAEVQFLQVASALAVYRTLHEGNYPDKLDALIPDLLPKVPSDHFTGAPLVYTKTHNGYLLVCCGPNGIDEGGMQSQYNFYKGYSLDMSQPERVAAISQLLGEELTVKNVEGVEAGDPVVLWTFEEMIPRGSDDLSLRFPLLKE